MNFIHIGFVASTVVCLYTPSRDTDVLVAEADAGLQELANRIDDAANKTKVDAPTITADELIAGSSFILAVFTIPLLIVSHCRRIKYIW